VREAKKISDDIITESISSLNIETNTPNIIVQHDEEYINDDTVFEDDVKEMTAQVIVRKSPLPVLLLAVIVLIALVLTGYFIYFGKHPRKMMNEKVSSTVTKPLDNTIPDNPVKPMDNIHTEEKTGPKGEEVANGAAENTSVKSDAAPMKPSLENTVADPFKNGKIILDFSYNTNEFSKTGYAALNDLVHYMSSHPDIKISVVGFTDRKGNELYNLSLSEFRANNMKSYLVGKGVDVDRIYTSGKGSKYPRASNSSPSGRQFNRRVEIEVVKETAGK
jgi:outer membrane protein OmpA-like peptidoglycan-associated protein